MEIEMIIILCFIVLYLSMTIYYFVRNNILYEKLHQNKKCIHFILSSILWPLTMFERSCEYETLVIKREEETTRMLKEMEKISKRDGR